MFYVAGPQATDVTQVALNRLMRTPEVVIFYCVQQLEVFFGRLHQALYSQLGKTVKARLIA